jgi:hypothetical protein
VRRLLGHAELGGMGVLRALRVVLDSTVPLLDSRQTTEI